MKISCPKCQAVYSINDALVGEGGVKAQCPACGDLQVVKRPDAESPGSSATPPPIRPPAPPPPSSASSPPPGLSDNPLDDLELGDGGEPSAPAAADDLFGDIGLGATPSVGETAAAGPADVDPFADIGMGEAASTGKPAPSAADDPFADIGLAGPPASAASTPGADLGSIPTAGAGSAPPPLPASGGPPHGGGAEPVSPAAAADRCDRCGGKVSGPKQPDGLCERCRLLALEDAGAGNEDREWRVKRADGVILGPLTLAEVKMKYQAGEITASEQLARGEGDFRLISSFPEFAHFFRRPGDDLRPVFRHAPPSHAVRNIVILLVVLLVGGVLGVVFLYPELLSFGGDQQNSSVVEDALAEFSSEIHTPDGTSAEAVSRGKELMFKDERLSYLEADRNFKMALILDPTNLDAYAGWVQNRALLDAGASEVRQRKVALDLIDHAIERAPASPTLLRAKAYLLYSLQQIREARDLANKVLTLEDEDPETLLILGATYLDSSTELAVSMFQRALKANDKLILSYRMLGEAKIRLGKFHEALRFFEQRLEKDPGQFASLDAMARVYVSVGKFSKARGMYERILGTDPERVESALALSRLLTQVFRNPKGSIKLLDGMLGAKDAKISAADRAELLAEKSVALRLLGSVDKAKAAVEEALQLDPMSIPALYSQAWLALRSGDLKSALVWFRSMRTHLPESPHVILLIAESEAQVPHFEVAIKQYQLAVDAGPELLDSYLMLASLYLELDNPNQAYAWLRKATSVDPYRDRTHRAPTAYYNGTDMMNSTIKRVKDGAVKYADDPLAQALAGAVYWRAGQDEQAMARLYRALDSDSECFPANLYMGALLLAKGQARRAMSYLTQAHKSNGLHQVATVLLAYAHLQTGNAKKAEKMAKSVLKADPGDLTARLCMAEALLARKKRKAAIETLLKVYEGDNENLRAKELLFSLGE